MHQTLKPSWFTPVDRVLQVNSLVVPLAVLRCSQLAGLYCSWVVQLFYMKAALHAEGISILPLVVAASVVPVDSLPPPL
jgi:hypothetical protein